MLRCDEVVGSLEKKWGMINIRHLCKEMSMEKTCCGPSQYFVNGWNRTVPHGPFLIQEEVETRLQDLESVVKAETLVGIGEVGAVEMIRVFQKATMETFRRSCK